MTDSSLMDLYLSENGTYLLEDLLCGERTDVIKEYIPKKVFDAFVGYLKKNGLAEESDNEVILRDGDNLSLIEFEKNFRKSGETLRQIMDFFIDHEVYFPDEFLPRMYELRENRRVISDHKDILKPHNSFIEIVKRSKEISGLTCICFSDYPAIFGRIVESKVTITLVVTPDVYKVVSGVPQMKYDNVALYVNDALPKMGLTVTDTFLSLGFCYTSGNYDFTRDLIATSPDALSFGRDLIEYYRKKSRRVF